jgi:mono/diheme cytochrome c family protein
VKADRLGRRDRSIVFGLLPLALICSSAGAQEPPAKFPREQISKGAELYAANCESCHGVRMVGPQWGIDLATFPRDNPSRFVNSVTNGTKAMPPWGDVLKPEEIQALWAYVVAGESGPR